jgi:hypothetical protein
MSTSGGRKVALFAGSVVVGLLAAVVVADVARDDTEETILGTGEADEVARRVPFLSSEPAGALSGAVGLVGADAPDGDGVRGWLATWGALLDDPGNDDPAVDLQVDDGRVFGVEVGPVYTDPCIDDPADEGCPDRSEVDPAVVEGEGSLGPNAAVVHVFPRSDAELVAECGFEGLAPDELAIAVATANPGRLDVHVGALTYTDVAAVGELNEFLEWQSTGDVPRPPSSFVAHCLAVPRPTSSGATEVRVVAVDGAGQIATAETTVVPSAPGMPAVTVTPIDGSMIRVDVPLRDTGDAEVFVVPAGPSPSDPPACPLEAPAPGAGWRVGSSALVEDAATNASSPYVRQAPRLRRVTVAVPEGEPSLLCVDPIGIETSPVELVVTPPDARRLTLRVAEVDAPDGIGDEDLTITGTFAAMGWAPCAVVLTGVPSGVLEPGFEGLLCTSGGDTGAIAAAGGMLDLAVGVGRAVHTVRIALSATPGGDQVEAYRLPIPAPGFEGVLCTDDVEQPGCVPPEGDAVLGSLTVTATWDEGPTGLEAWTIVQAP